MKMQKDMAALGGILKLVEEVKADRVGQSSRGASMAASGHLHVCAVVSSERESSVCVGDGPRNRARTRTKPETAFYRLPVACDDRSV